MLTLSRQKDEQLIISRTGTDDDPDLVEITIVDIRGDRIRVGITAPRHMHVHRKEIWMAIQKEKKANPG